MSNSFPKNVRIPIAQSKRNKFNLSGDTVTTTDFNKLKSVFIREVVPGDKISLSTESLFRTLSPLNVPTCGRMKVINRTFFVPMRTIFRGWNSFITETPQTLSNESIPTNVPKFAMKDMLSFIINQGRSTDAPSDSCFVADYHNNWVDCKAVGSSITGTYDFVVKHTYGDSSVKLCAFNFNDRGRNFAEILFGLGYNLNYNETDTTEYSLLPLLAWYKIYFDYYLNPSYTSAFVGKIYNIKSLSELAANYDCTDIIVTKGVSYEPDYFTAAWQHPNGPNGSNGSQMLVTPDYTSQQVISDAEGNTFVRLNNNTQTNVSLLNQLAVKSLQYLTNWIRRNQITGFRPFDRYLARYDRHLDSTQTNRSVLIDSHVFDMSVAEVVSTTDNYNENLTADVRGANLGQIAGKSQGYGKSHCNFDSDEYGYLIVMSSIIPKIGYVQGNSRTHRHLTKFDFYTPEFDNLGTQAIANSELYDGQNPTHALNSGTFGFTPRYSEYKVTNSSFDILSGDFRLKSKSEGYDSWHTFRLFNNVETLGLPFVMTDTVTSTRALPADRQYDRIFNYQHADYDHFVAFFNFECHATRNMSSLMTPLLPEDEEHNNSDVSVPVGGTFVN